MKYGYTKSYIRKIQCAFRKRERLERQARRENGGGLSAAYWKRAVAGTVNKNKPEKPEKAFDAGDLFYE
jgi:hypothetical protein